MAADKLKGLLLALGVLGIVVLAGCDSTSGDSSSVDVTLPLVAPYGTQAEDLRAFAVVDDGERTELTVDPDALTVSGVIENVASGRRTLVIIIEVDDPILGIVEIASATLTVDVSSSGTTPVTFDQSDYVYGEGGGRWDTMEWDRTNWR